MGDPSGDTIVALGTPPGRAALAVIRVSGPSAIPLVAARLHPGSRLADHPPRTAHLAAFVGDDGVPLDQVLVTAFPGPGSYTGDDVVEISVHGNPVIAGAVVDALVADGARPADPGEFTRRAFLNGKLDLAQAEAVATLIGARSRAAARSALLQLEGALTSRVREIRAGVVGILAGLEAIIDFPEEELASSEHAGLRDDLERVEDRLRAIIEGVRRGRPLAERSTVALLGRPNVGKSSLFNALLGRERAIVHADPGTTRDVVDADLLLGDLPLRLVDTAGLRAVPQGVEAEGVRRSRELLEGADLRILVLDGTKSRLDPEEVALLDDPHPAGNGPPLLGVVNKCDLEVRLDVPDGLLRVSARSGLGLPGLETAITEGILGGSDDAGDRWVAGARQEALLIEAGDALRRAQTLVRTSPEAAELVAEELRSMLESLDALTGERTGDEVLDVIFSTFCIGK